MDNKSTKEATKQGVYLSNFVATALSFFVLVLAFSAGFFAKSYFKEKPLEDVKDADTTVTQPTKETSATLPMIKDTFNKALIKFGNADNKLVFVEASDPSCPYCSIASGKNGELNNKAGDTFKLVKDGGSYVAPVEEINKLVDSGKASYALIYRNGHGSGEMGMKALYCAFDQKKFWQAHDLIMSAEGYTLLNETIKNDKSRAGDLASFLGSVLDQSALKTCLESGKYDNRLNEDTKLGDSLGIQGTPTFFVNDKVYPGAYSFEQMKDTVDSFLK